MTLIGKNSILFALAQTSATTDQPIPNLDFISRSVEAGTWPSVAMMLVAATAIIMFVILIIQVLKMRHTRTMAMIEKGIYHPKPKDWNRILKLAGVFLLCITPGVVLLVILQEGLSVGIWVGSVMILVGIGVLVFRRLAREYLPSPSQNENQKERQ